MPRRNRLPGLSGKVMAEKEGSARREDSNYNIEMRIQNAEKLIRNLEAKLRAIEDKIRLVRKVTRDSKGNEVILVK